MTIQSSLIAKLAAVDSDTSTADLFYLMQQTQTVDITNAIYDSSSLFPTDSAFAGTMLTALDSGSFIFDGNAWSHIISPPEPRVAEEVDNRSAMEVASEAYAAAIAVATGGQVIIHDPAVDGTDLTLILGETGATPYQNAIGNGDVLYLKPGAYTITSWHTTYSASFFPRGHYSVIGADPNTVSIYIDNGGNPTPRAEAFFSYDDNGASLATYGTLQLNVGYLTLAQYAHTAINYQVPLVHGLGTQLDYITCKHVAFNRGNAVGSNSPLSWLYDNNNDQGTVRIEKCTFFNISSLLTSYTGNATNKTIDKCLISRATGSSSIIPETNTTTIAGGITEDGFFATYDTTVYTDRGHLILDTESITYTEPTAFG